MKIRFIFLTLFALAFALNWEPYKGKYLVQQGYHENPFWESVQQSDKILYQNSKNIGQIVDKEDLKKIKNKNSDARVYNLESLIKAETAKLSNRKTFNANDDPATIDLQTFHNLSEIHAFINAAAKKHNSIASIFNIGKSFQKRDILGIKIGNPNLCKKSVLLHSLIHPREWITGATTVKMIYELLETNKYASLLDTIDFFIIPVFNVDGYEYTWTTDRFWRKSLSGPYENGAIGVDLNRNFDWNWSDPTNQDAPPSDETYSGPKAFSEIENQNLEKFVESFNSLFSYWDFHSCSGDFFFPNGVDKFPVYQKYLEAGNIFVNATSEVGKTNYKFCEPDSCIYKVTGDTMDYFFFKQNVTFSFATEIGKCSGDDFVVPESQIQSLTDEILAGFFAVINFLVTDN
uniref:Peptidase M14 carboxypeptidase A domain-containing protein n=1 Tax=Panagrolaimus sp. ES5 TaxID=591445 RepID=A0AC34FJ14_9BILA